MSSITEKQIEKYLKTEVKKAGGLSFKFSSPAHRGVPDQIVLFYGCVCFVEVKSINGKLSRLQEKCINDMTRLYADVWVVYSKEDVDDFLRHCKNYSSL